MLAPLSRTHAGAHFAGSPEKEDVLGMAPRSLAAREVRGAALSHLLPGITCPREVPRGCSDGRRGSSAIVGGTAFVRPFFQRRHVGTVVVASFCDGTVWEQWSFGGGCEVLIWENRILGIMNVVVSLRLMQCRWSMTKRVILSFESLTARCHGTDGYKMATCDYPTAALFQV